MKKLLMLEFNELSPVLMHQFISEGHLPNFAKLRETSRCYQTHTTDDELQPWVQWTTFHLGVPQSKHGIFSLDEGHIVTSDFVWDDLFDSGVNTLVFGAMNGNRRRNGVELLPDSWSSQVQGSDETLSTLHAFSKLTVQEHTNPSKALSLPQMAKYAMVFARKGLRLRTAWALAVQLASERMNRDKDLKWRRACLFDRLMWDTFRHCWSTSDAEAAVFFGNSTAYLQHRYWRSLESDQFEIKPSAKDVESYGDAILSGYQNMDGMVGEILNDPELADATVVLATALSQHANPDRRSEAPHKAYRPPDFASFLDWAGATGFSSVEPLMTHLAWATFATSEAAAAAVRAISAVEVDGKQAFDHELHDGRVKFWCSLTEEMPTGTMMKNLRGDSVPFNETMSVAASSLIDGTHHRDGIFWIRDGKGGDGTGVSEIPLENAKRLVLESVLSGASKS